MGHLTMYNLKEILDPWCESKQFLLAALHWFIALGLSHQKFMIYSFQISCWLCLHLHGFLLLDKLWSKH